MGWQLAPGTGFCEAGGELIFLDLVRDKYLALRGRDRAAFERLQAGEPNDSDDMTRLVHTGLIERRSGSSQIAPTTLSVPMQDLSAEDPHPFSFGMTVKTAWSLRWARGAMEPSRIAATVDRLRQAKRRIGVPGAEEPARRIAVTFAANRWVNPTPPRCLIDALALDRILLSQAIVASLVFGVRISPFNAHCWLQTPQTILTGTAAEARNFTPILVVE